MFNRISQTFCGRRSFNKISQNRKRTSFGKEESASGAKYFFFNCPFVQLAILHKWEKEFQNELTNLESFDLRRFLIERFSFLFQSQFLVSLNTKERKIIEAWRALHYLSLVSNQKFESQFKLLNAAWNWYGKKIY